MKKFGVILIFFYLRISGLPLLNAQATFPDTNLFGRFLTTMPNVFHRNYFEFTRDSIPVKTVFTTDSGSMERSFDPFGRITYEFLTLNDKTRLVRYFDKNGVCFKYRKAEDDQCQYIFSDREPYQWMFDSSKLVIERMLIKKFGADFYKKHLRIGEPSWNTVNPYAYGELMRQPFEKPSKISRALYLFLNDSSDTYLGTFELDSSLKPINNNYHSPLDILASPNADCIKKINLNSLRYAFTKKGYSFGSIDWDYEKNTFIAYYQTGLYFYLDGKDTIWEGKSLFYDLNTKKYTTDRYTPGYSIACGYSSPFKTEFEDTFSLAPGWRAEMLTEAIISIPPGWNIYTYEYSYGNKITYVTNGEDTLLYQLFYSLLVEWDDQMTDDPLHQELEKRFPQGNRLGRDVDFYIYHVGSNCYGISLSTVEEGVGMNFNEISNSFKFKRLCPGHISQGLDILNSIRFFRY
jgi:hypothetical protein